MNEAVMYAKYSQEGNKTIFGLLDKISNDEREKDRGSFYGSLSSLFRHVIGGTRFFLGISNPAAVKAISEIENLPKLPEGALSETQWKALESAAAAIDAAYIGMTEALKESDLSLPVKINWYGGNPDSVPLSFMLSQLVYSGINVSFIS